MSLSKTLKISIKPSPTISPGPRTLPSLFAIPENALLIASTETVPNAFFTVDNHILSIQGHPEFTPKYAADVASTRKELLGKEKYEYALNTLSNDLSDNKEGAIMWLNFFESNL